MYKISVDTAGSHTWFENKKTNEQFKATPEQRKNKEIFKRKS